MASNAALTLELEMREGARLHGLYFYDLTTLPNGQGQNTSDVVIQYI